MLLSSVVGLALIVVTLSAISPLAEATGNEIIVTLDKITLTHNENDIFDKWSTEIHSTKKSSQLSVTLPTKAEVPDTMQMKMIIKLGDGDPIESIMSFCEALEDDSVGKSFVDAGEPKDSFPKECPFGAGDWSVSKWNPPTDKIPPSTPDGPVTGTVSFYEDGKDPIIQLDFEGELTHK